MAYDIISADAHVLEPTDIWETWLPEAVPGQGAEAARRTSTAATRGCSRGRPSPTRSGSSSTPGHGVGQVPLDGRHLRRGPRRAATTATARLADMDIDGVDAEVLFPPQRTIGHFLGDDDDDFVRAGIDAYNNFLWDEFCAPDRDAGSSAWRRCRRPASTTPSSTLRKAQGPRLQGRGASRTGRPAATASPTTTSRSGRAAEDERHAGVHPHQPHLPPPAAAQRAAARRGGQAAAAACTAATARPRPTPRRSAGSRGVFCDRCPSPSASSSSPACSSASPSLHIADDRDGRRLDPALPRADGRPLLAQPVVGQHPDQRAAVVLLVPQHVGHVHHRPQRHRATATGSASTT